MPVCGWVVRLSHPESDAEACRAALAEWPGVTVGPVQGQSLPVVTESAAPGEVYAFPDRLMALPWVLHVDLAFSDLSDIDAVPEVQLRQGLRRRGGAAMSPSCEQKGAL